MDALLTLPHAPPAALIRLVLVVYGFIAACSAVTFAHPTLRRPEKRSVRQAINSWWPPALVGGVAVMGGGAVAYVIFAVMSAWTLAELLRMMSPSDLPPGVRAMAFAAVPLHYGAMLSGDADLAGGAALLAWAFLVMPLARSLRHGPEGAFGGAGRVGLALAATVFSLGFVARIFLLPARLGPCGPAGFAALLLLSVMINDAFQWLAGKTLGRTPLAPRVSPRKTWEGFAGGALVTALVASVAAPVVTSLTHLEGAALGACLSTLGLLGDLLISTLKRDVGVKDTGAVLPGQGGVLDRMDSLLLAAPAYYLFVRSFAA